MPKMIYESTPGSANIFLDIETTGESRLLTADFSEIEKRAYSFSVDPWPVRPEPLRSLFGVSISPVPVPPSRGQHEIDRICKLHGFDAAACADNEPMTRNEFEQLKLDAGLFDVRENMRRFIRAMQETMQGSPTGRRTSQPEAMTLPYGKDR